MKNDVFAVCISDFHIGECYGGISRSPKQLEQYQEIGDLEHGNIYVRTAFLRLLQLLPEMNHGKMIPYLIILGDMWDLAVNNTEDTFALSRRCFEHLNESKEYKSIGQVFSNVIYVPGNHDHHLWQMLQEKYWVTDPLMHGKSPREMPRVYPHTIPINGDWRENHQLKTEGIPTENLVTYLLGLDIQPTNKKHIPVYVAYPNLYLRKKSGDYILLTHGHLLEPNWNIVTTMFKDVLKAEAITMTLKNIEMFNALATESLGHLLAQTPPYDFLEVFEDMKISRWLNGNALPPGWLDMLQKAISAHISVRGKDSQPKTVTQKDHDIEALQLERELVEHYLNQSETDDIWKKEMSDSGCKGRITDLIYGHTHTPCESRVFERYTRKPVESVAVHNTGGWVAVSPDKYKIPGPVVIDMEGGISTIDYTAFA